MASAAFEEMIAGVTADLARQQAEAADATLEERRGQLDRAGAGRPLAPGAELRRTTAGGRPAAWIGRPGAPRVLLHLHGGAFATGSIASHAVLASHVAKACAADALLVEYRLAPEHRFPAALDDALAAYRWLLDEGVDPARLVVTGDSAGGGLALSLLVAARDRGVVLPAAAVLFSPWADLTLEAPSMALEDLDPFTTRAGLALCAAGYLGDHPRTDPLASPVFADLAGLPPLHVQVGGREVLLDDARTVVRRALAAGVDARLLEEPEMVHTWVAFAGLVPEADEAVAAVGRFVDEVAPLTEP